MSIGARIGLPVRRLGEALPSPVQWANPLQGFDLGKATKDLHHAVSRLLMGWPLGDIELAAWEFALDGWQRPPPLVEDYDAAFEHYLVLVDYRRVHDSDASGISALTLVVEELRNRVQFLQTRAADIRLSTQFDRLLVVGIERLAPTLEQLAERLINKTAGDQRAALEALSGSSEGEFLAAVARAVGRHNGALGAGVASLGPVIAQLRRLKSVMADGVAGNAAYDALKILIGVLAAAQ